MQVYDSIFGASLTGPTHLTVGNFDGVHRGHRSLIATMRKAASSHSAAAGLLTFHPHPRSVLGADQPITSLASLTESLTMYEGTGLDFTVVHPFTLETAQTSAEGFLEHLQGHLGVSKLWVGPDFALGRGRKGDVAFLREYGGIHGLEVEVIPEFYWEGETIRSSRIRRLIEIGNVEWAAGWLGRYYTVPGIVVHGAERGRTIGFPTANLSPAQSRAIPADGVYATRTWLNNNKYPSVTNIGTRPTLNGTHRTIEAHIIDFDLDVYGRCIQLEFISRLRDEVRFSGVEPLKAQIARDRDRAAALLTQDPTVSSTPRFEEIPHTADWVIRIEGESQAKLYGNAALAMFSLQGAAEIEGPTVRQRFAIEGADREDLLVRWLSELLWQADTQGVVFQNFWVESITDTAMQAEAVGRQGRSALAHIKAVTYHELNVNQPDKSSSGRWEAQVLFDT